MVFTMSEKILKKRRKLVKVSGTIYLSLTTILPENIKNSEYVDIEVIQLTKDSLTIKITPSR